jgi:CIC family chloride channel protein
MPSATAWRRRLTDKLTSLGFPRDWLLIPPAIIIGILGGLAATGFDRVVHHTVHFFYWRFHELDLTLGHAALLLAIPAGGGLVVGVIRYFFGKEMGGHGVPAVITALARQGGRMRARVGVLRAITATVTIGTGGSAGVEGPIIQIGSVIGSVVSQLARVSRENMQALVGAGAAAGLAGIFNAPIAAVLFVVEVMLRDFSLKTFIPIIIASVLGAATSVEILGTNEALFMVPADVIAQHSFALSEAGYYALLGILCGVVGWGFTQTLHGTEALVTRVPGHPIAKPVIGGLVLGLMGVAFLWAFGSPLSTFKPPLFFANGYPVVESLFRPATYTGGAGTTGGAVLTQATLALLMVTLLGKLLATSVTLGSGGSGGVFAPSLFMGATLGAAFGMVLDATGWVSAMTPATYALTGMAGVLAATVHCPLTAFLLVFELTRDPKAILPAMLVAILAVVVAQALHRDSVYTTILRYQGIRIGKLSDMTLLRRLSVEDVSLMAPVTVQQGEPAQRLIDLAGDYTVVDYVVCDDAGQYRGMVVGHDVRNVLLEREAVPLMIVDDLMRSDLPTVGAAETLDVVLDKFSQHDVSSLPVVDETGALQGVISRTQLMRLYQRTLDQSG